MFRWCRWQVSYPDQGSKVTESLAAASQPQPPHPPPHDVALPVLTPEPDLCEHRTWPLWSGCSDHVALVSVGCRHLYTPGTQNTEPILIPSTCPIQPGNHSTLILIQKCCVKSREHTVQNIQHWCQGLWANSPRSFQAYQYGPTLSCRRQQVISCLHWSPHALGNHLVRGYHSLLLGQVTTVQVSSIDVRHKVVATQQDWIC